jgi:hypothetical protein
MVDIGGDAIADGSEPGLASPLCDATMLAAGLEVDSTPVTVGVLGAGCDGELRPAEVVARVAALARTGSWVGTLSVSPAAAEEIERAALLAVTEASLLVARCARGEVGETPIRGGRRSVQLSPIGAACFLFDLPAAAAELPLVAAVAGSESIGAANDALNALGVGTELDYEELRAAER